MTQEQKAKAYDEALERARNLHKDATDMEEGIFAKQCEIIFPELRESEDEKIRGDIISLVNEFWERIGSINPEYSSRSSMIDWLEKQKFTQKDVDDAWLKGICDAKDELEKKKPAWSEEDEEMCQNILECLRNGWRKLPTDILKYESWLKSLRPQPKQEWSEEDERLLSKLQLYVDMECFDRECNGQDLLDWLRCIKQRNTWKPSKEQLEFLQLYADQNNYDGTVLTSLLNDLKKL